LEKDGSGLSTALTISGLVLHEYSIGAWMLCGVEPADCQAVYVQQVLYWSGRGPVTGGGGGDTGDDDRGSEW